MKKKIPFSQETNKEQRDKAKQKNWYNHHYAATLAPPSLTHHRHKGGSGQATKPQPDSSLIVTTLFQILCHNMKAQGVIGKSGSIIKSIRQHTDAWINVHELIPRDEERIIEISDTRQRLDYCEKGFGVKWGEECREFLVGG